MATGTPSPSELGRAVLEELAAHHAGPSLDCPGCGRGTAPVTVRSVPLDLCMGCGGTWLDRGELSKLSGGVHEEIAVLRPTEPARDSLASPRPWPAGAWLREAREDGSIRFRLPLSSRLHKVVLGDAGVVGVAVFAALAWQWGDAVEWGWAWRFVPALLAFSILSLGVVDTQVEAGPGWLATVRKSGRTPWVNASTQDSRAFSERRIGQRT